jgi:hypothetical protein
MGLGPHGVHPWTAAPWKGGEYESSSRSDWKGREEFGWNFDSPPPLGLESKGGVRGRTRTPILLGLWKGQAGLAAFIRGWGIGAP